MATTIKLKNSVTTTNAPSSLVQGEVAINITDKKVWVGNAATTPIQLLGDGGSVQFTTVDTTNLQVTNIKAKDGTASASIANSTGALTVAAAFSANGGATLGDASGDALTINSSAVSIPNGLNFDSNTLVIDAANNNVGIGTSSPSGSSKLDVVGGRTFLQSSDEFTLRVGTVANPAGGYIGSTGTDILNFYSGSGTERMRIDASGNVGIGVTNPDVPLNVLCNSSADGLTLRGRSSDNISRITFKNNANSSTYGRLDVRSDLFIVNAVANIPLLFNTNDSERMRIDSSGNVGVGTSSPSARLNVVGGAIRGDISTAGTSLILSGTGSNFQVDHSVSGFATLLNSGGGLAFNTNGTERMRIDSSGRLLVGTTAYPSTSVGGIGFEPSSNSRTIVRSSSSSTATGNELFQFWNPNGQVGYIGTNANSTTYSTTSDYRLKENISPMIGALDKIIALKPCTYTWKSDGSAGQGFIAHELQEVVSDCVTGEKDAVDEKGNPVYQGVDTSFLVATLTAAIQELNAKVTELEAKLK